jgi:preprotein translocase subunit YajC
MLGLLSAVFTLFAQAAPAAAGKLEQPQNALVQYLPLLPIPFVFYFMLIRPQQQQEKKRREMINQLKKNDKVVTASGMYGTVISVDEQGDKVQLRLDDDGKVKITFTKASIVRVLNDSSEKSSESK